MSKETSYVTPELDEYIERIEQLVHRQVGKLLRGGYVASGDCEDVAQELLMHVIVQWPNLDTSKFAPLLFAKLVINQKTSNVLRKYYSKKESFNRSHVVITPTVANQLTAADPDLSFALADLCPEDRELANTVAENGQVAAARQLGVTEAEVKRKRIAIGRQLRNNSV